MSDESSNKPSAEVEEVLKHTPSAISRGAMNFEEPQPVSPEVKSDPYPKLDKDIYEFALLIQVKRNESLTEDVKTDNRALMDLLVEALQSEDEDQMIVVAMLAMQVHFTDGPTPGQMIQADGEDDVDQTPIDGLYDIGEDKE